MNVDDGGVSDDPAQQPRKADAARRAYGRRARRRILAVFVALCWLVPLGYLVWTINTHLMPAALVAVVVCTILVRLVSRLVRGKRGDAKAQRSAIIEGSLALFLVWLFWDSLILLVYVVVD